MASSLGSMKDSIKMEDGDWPDKDISYLCSNDKAWVISFKWVEIEVQKANWKQNSQ